MEGYYITPNNQVPLNDRLPGEIAEIAQQQLAIWNQIAQTWPIETDHNRLGREAVVCGQCSQVIWFLSDMGRKPYIYTPQMELALKVGHIRQNHSEAGNGQIP